MRISDKPGPILTILLFVAGILSLFIVWALIPEEGHRLAVPLSATLESIADLARSGILMRDITASVVRVTCGIGLAIFVCINIVCIAGFVRGTLPYLSGIIDMFRPIPPIAWTPLAIIAFGIGDLSAILIVAIGAFFPIFSGVVQGYNSLHRNHLLSARSLGASSAMIFWRITLPAISPYVSNGLRLGVGLGWFSVVAAEMVGANSGLGYAIQLASLNLEIEKIYAYLLTIAVVGLMFQLIVTLIDNRFNSWRRGEFSG